MSAFMRQTSDLMLVRRLNKPPEGGLFELAADFTFELAGFGRLRVPAGFVTDLASVPRPLRGVVSAVDGIEAAVAHDWLYAQPRVPRAIADGVFLHLLAGHVSDWRRWAMWLGVRLGGHWARKASLRKPAPAPAD